MIELAELQWYVSEWKMEDLLKVLENLRMQSRRLLQALDHQTIEDVKWRSDHHRYCTDLVARETKDDEVFILVLVVKFLQSLVLRCETAA